MSRAVLAGVLVGVAFLAGCGSGKTEGAPTSTETGGSDSNVEQQQDPKTWFAQTCPLQLQKFESGEDLYLKQGAVSFSADALKYEPRLWRYDKNTMRAESIQVMDGAVTFCFRDDATTEEIKFNGEKFTILPVTGPSYPAAGGYYVSRPARTSFDILQSIDHDKKWYVINEGLTPVTDEAKSSAVVVQGYAPGDGPG